MEVAMNSLLICSGSLGFILAIICAFLTCVAGNCCIDHRVKFYDFNLNLIV